MFEETIFPVHLVTCPVWCQRVMRAVVAVQGGENQEAVSLQRQVSRKVFPRGKGVGRPASSTSRGPVLTLKRCSRLAIIAITCHAKVKTLPWFSQDVKGFAKAVVLYQRHSVWPKLCNSILFWERSVYFSRGIILEFMYELERTSQKYPSSQIMEVASKNEGGTIWNKTALSSELCWKIEILIMLAIGASNCFCLHALWKRKKGGKTGRKKNSQQGPSLQVSLIFLLWRKTLICFFTENFIKRKKEHRTCIYLSLIKENMRYLVNLWKMKVKKKW